MPLGSCESAPSPILSPSSVPPSLVATSGKTAMSALTMPSMPSHAMLPVCFVSTLIRVMCVWWVDPLKDVKSGKEVWSVWMVICIVSRRKPSMCSSFTLTHQRHVPRMKQDHVNLMHPCNNADMQYKRKRLFLVEFRRKHMALNWTILESATPSRIQK